MGDVLHYLGIDIEETENGIWLYQKSFIKKILQHFKMEHCKSMGVSMNPNITLEWDMNSPPTDIKLYQALVGCLLFATITRLDLKYVIGIVSRYGSAPQKTHMTIAENILRYLKGTNDYGFFYSKHEEGNLKSFVDVDYTRDLDTRRSTSHILYKWRDAHVD